jgi:hypothetical protein
MWPWDLFWGPPRLLSSEFWGLFHEDKCGQYVKLNIYLYLLPRLRRSGGIFLLLHSSSCPRLYPRCVRLIDHSLQLLINWKDPVITLCNRKILSLNIRRTADICSNNRCIGTKCRHSAFEADVKWQHFPHWCVLSRFSGFHILAVSTVLWDVTPWSPVEFNGRCCASTLRAREWVVASRKQPFCSFLSLLFDSEDGGITILRNTSKLIPECKALHLTRLIYVGLVSVLIQVYGEE